MYVTHSTAAAPAAIPYRRNVPPKLRATAQLHSRHVTGIHRFREGDDATFIYEIRTGSVRLTRVLENGRRQVIAFGLPGDIIGFPDEDRHHTNCDIIDTADIIAYPHRLLDTGEVVDPDTHQRLLGAALREITAMQDHFMMLARKSAMEKVASFLHVLSRRTGTPIGNCMFFSLPMSRTDIADFLGLTVSRTFSLLRKQGLIALETPQPVLVLDQDALVATSQNQE